MKELTSMTGYNKYRKKSLLRLIPGIIFAMSAIALSLSENFNSNITAQGLAVLTSTIGGWLIASGLYYAIPFRYGSPWNAEMRFRGTAFEYACGLAMILILLVITYNVPLFSRINQPVASSQVRSTIKTSEGGAEFADRYKVEYSYQVQEQTYTIVQTNQLLPKSPQNVAYNPADPSDSTVIGAANSVEASLLITFIASSIFIVASFGFFYVFGKIATPREHGSIQQRSR